MSGVTLIDPSTDRKWDDFVEGHPLGWLCHLSGWKHVLERSFPHIRGRCLVIADRDGSIRAALPIYAVRSRITGKRLVSIPFATISDPLVTSERDMDELAAAAIDLHDDSAMSYLEIRTLAAAPFVGTPLLGRTCLYKLHYIALTDDPEDLKKTFHRSCVRQRIARAMKSNLTVKAAEGESDIRDFYGLYLSLRKRLCLPPMPYGFINALWETFSPQKRVSVLLAMADNKAVAGVFLYKFKDRVSVEFATADETYRDVSPIHLLFWESMKRAVEEGYRVFDFGRTPVGNTALMEFKSHWGTEVSDVPHFYYPSEMRRRIETRFDTFGYRLTRKICAHAPIYAFERLGRLCYRHIS
jgi:hypothetical protein